MCEMSIVRSIAEVVSQYEEKLLYDVDSDHHRYVLEYDEDSHNMFLKLEESYCSGVITGIWIDNYTIVERYSVTSDMYANICVIVFMDHLLIQRSGCGTVGSECVMKVWPQFG